MDKFIKCKWCPYTTKRFGKKGKYHGRTLMLHVIHEHTDRFLASIGFNGSLMEYLDMKYGEDDYRGYKW